MVALSGRPRVWFVWLARGGEERVWYGSKALCCGRWAGQGGAGSSPSAPSCSWCRVMWVGRAVCGAIAMPAAMLFFAVESVTLTGLAREAWGDAEKCGCIREC